MENVLQKPIPPPSWELTLILNENGDPIYLRKAHLIIKSFLEPWQMQHTRTKKGTHVFRLHSVGKPIDRSILWTIESETWPHLKIIGGISRMSIQAP